MELMYVVKRGFAFGAKYGLKKGMAAYASDEVTPEIDETAMQGAIGIIIAVGGVLIALYIIGIVVGSISYSVVASGEASGWAARNGTYARSWCSTLNNMDTSAQASFNLANVMPIVIIGVGILMIVIGAFSGPGI